MAKRSKMFKTLNNVHLEDLSVAGNWNSFARIEKQQNQMISAFVDKVRVSYLLDTEISDAADCGVMIVASVSDTLDNATPSNNDEFIIAASAGRLIGGVITLDLKRSIKSNAENLNRGDGEIYLFARCTDQSSTTAVKLWLNLETHGRWLSVVST